MSAQPPSVRDVSSETKSCRNSEHEYFPQLVCSRMSNRWPRKSRRSLGLISKYQATIISSGKGLMLRANGKPRDSPMCARFAQDFTLDNSWLLRVGPGYLPPQYPASLGLAPSDGARARLFRFTHRPVTLILGLAPSKGSRARDVSGAP